MFLDSEYLTLNNGFLIHDLWVRNFFWRYCAIPLEEYSSGMCVVFAERVGEIATSARFDSFYHALLISQRELSRQDERFAARFHRFARLAKDRSDVGLRRVLVEKRSLVAGTKAR